MAELSYQGLKASRNNKESDDQKRAIRKRNALVLIRDYLYEMGYTDTSAALEAEVNISLDSFGVCDNVDLETVLQDYESYYYVRFSKLPQIVKRIEGTEQKDAKDKNWKSLRVPKLHHGTSKEKLTQRRRAVSCFPAAPCVSPSAFKRVEKQNGTDCLGNGDQPSSSSSEISLNGRQLSSYTKPKDKLKPPQEKDFESSYKLIEGEVKILKPLGLYSGYSEEWRELASVIGKDIYQHNPNVRWDSIVGLDKAKRLIKESVVYPIKYPQLFTGILSPWKGLLLYGPPGTGKTLLAKAVATECQTTFFNISASSIVSKWRGDSEKLVRILFELARFHAPSTIFLDELDALMSQRDSGLGSEHEGSRRMKTELLIQMDGLSKTDDLVFLLAASNLPWHLDHAMLRRLEKRILVDLPNSEARQAMFKYFLPPVVDFNSGLKLNCELDYGQLAESSECYSGSDIHLVCKEAAMQQVRKVFDVLERAQTTMDTAKLSLDKVTTEEVQNALQRTKPLAKKLSVKYKDWQKEFGSS